MRMHRHPQAGSPAGSGVEIGRTSRIRRAGTVTAAKVSGASGAQVLLDPDTAIDLTANVESGRLVWTIPTAGTWRVSRVLLARDRPVRESQPVRVAGCVDRARPRDRRGERTPRRRHLLQPGPDRQPRPHGLERVRRRQRGEARRPGRVDLPRLARGPGAGVLDWWVFNPTDAPVTTTGSFAATGAPSALDLWNGTSERVARYTQDGGRTAIPLSVPAHGTVAYLIHRGASRLHVTSTTADRATLRRDGTIAVESAKSGSHTVTLSNGRTTTVDVGSVPAPARVDAWHLSVDEITPDGHAGHELDLTGLENWRDIPELESAVGSAVYSADIHVPVGWLAANRDVRLDLGAFTGATRTFVNGTLVTAQATPGGDHAIGELLHPGVNHLVVQLDTTVNNRNAQLAASGNGAYATGPTPLGPLPSGLLGPVTLTPVGVGVVNTTPSQPGGTGGAPGGPPIVTVPGTTPISPPSVRRATLRASARRTVKLAVRCPATANGRCKGRIQIVRGDRILATRKFTIRAGRTRTLTLKLTRSAFRSLLRRGHETVTVSVSARGSDGASRQTLVRMRLSAPK